MPPRRRLDQELVRRGLVESRTQAAEAIAAGRVTVSGAAADKAARLVAPSEPVELLGPPARFVSRGGEKLDGALELFGIDVSGLRVLDAGASTGGFTDCLLQRGARTVLAVDVGHGQLHPRIRHDPRVVVAERTNIRQVDPEALGGPADAVVCDLSFISLSSVLDALIRLVVPGAPMVLLVKPQFEAGRAEVSKGRGVVRDPEVHERVRLGVDDALRERGATIMGWMTSPLRGADGNVEFFVWAVTPGSGR